MTDLFNQYQKSILKLLNSPYRKYFDIPHIGDSKILKVYANGVVIPNGKDLKWLFWGKDVITDELLKANFFSADVNRHFHYAWLSTPFNTGAGDGHLRTAQGSWASARNDTSAGDSVDYTSTSLRMDGLRSGSNRFIGRGRLPFDTSALGASAAIASATIQINCSSVNGSFNQHNLIYLDNVASALASFTTLTANDYDNFGTTVQSDSQFNCSTTGIKSISLNATGIASISLTSFTDWGLRSYEDHNNSEPVNDGDGSQCNIDTSENGTSGNRPLLTVITPDILTTGDFEFL